MKKCIHNLNVITTMSLCKIRQWQRLSILFRPYIVAVILGINQFSTSRYRDNNRSRNFTILLTNSKVSHREMATQKHNTELFYNTVLKIVKEVGELIREKTSSREKTIEIKSSQIDFVTETDQQAEKLLISNLSAQFPDHKFIGEESVSAGSQCNLTDAPTWIIDPIDGTMNFVHSFPHSCISIALFINKLPEIGIVYNPVLNQLYTAQKGKGAFLNGKRIQVSGVTSLSESLLMLEFGTSRDPEKMRVILENQQKFLPQVHGLRALGSCALNMSAVAAGAADAYFEFGIHIWDIAAGELIIKEAGGVIMDPAGGEIDRLSRRMLVASSQELAEKLTQQIVQFYPTPRD